MNKRNFFVMGFAAFVCSVILTQTCFAGNIRQIKQRMKQRLPVIVKMKHQGIIGENSSGYLEFVTNRKINVNVVKEENKDRKMVYSMIASQQGVSIQKVENLRALQIVRKAGKGDYLKRKNGTWYRK